ncbi:UbiA family prenyltransferase [Nonomuraea sp. NPDC050536]|uniref:UbiA family prenyltransferase n=1 Tax=Nonomuraea sp. NPDC050536 TaxID=3364366 RepID=UPI0037C9355B
MCVVETRPSVLALFTLRFAVGAVLGERVLGANDATCLQVLCTLLVWILVIFAVYLFNGVEDLQEDRANGSARPIARGSLTPGTALGVAGAATLAALVGALSLPSTVSWMVPAILLLGYMYSGPPFHLKRTTAGTAAIGITASLMTYAAGYLTQTDGWVHQIGVLVVFTAAVSLWTGLVGGLTKDLSDIEGDAAAGRRTLSVTRGERTVRMLAALAALGTACGFTAAVLALQLPLVAAAVIMTTGAVTLAVVALGPISRGSRSRRRRPYRTYMMTQYVVHLILVVSIAISPVAWTN